MAEIVTVTRGSPLMERFMTRGDAGTVWSAEKAEGRVADRDTRQAIIDAAHQLLLERGNAGIKVRSVAMRVGVTTGALYGYFNTREDLVSAAYAYALTKSIESFGGIVEPNQAPTSWGDEQDTEVANALSDAGRDMRLAWLDATLRARHDPMLAHAIAREQNEILRTLSDRVREDQSHGHIDPTLDPLAVALVTFGSSLGVAAMWSLVENVPDLEAKIGLVWSSARFVDVPVVHTASPIAVQQACGIVAQREGVDIEEAAVLLRQAAAAENSDLDTFARRLVAGVTKGNVPRQPNKLAAS